MESNILNTAKIDKWCLNKSNNVLTKLNENGITENDFEMIQE